MQHFAAFYLDQGEGRQILVPIVLEVEIPKIGEVLQLVVYLHVKQ